MLANRVLPPLHPAPPVATFFNTPRRYTRSNMSISNEASRSPMVGVDSGQQLQKSGRLLETRIAPALSLVQRTKEVELPPPASASPGALGKRMAPFEMEANGGEAGDAADSSALASASPTSGELSGHVCLCQPEPKIPRPRNAFILYRQHHQHAIVAGNPGLANPEISKIIGELWQAESEGEKKIWQDLAQEEKVRHSEQYPDYRYQPRRLGKPGSLPSNPSGQHTTVEKYRCPRCGGRSIRTPTSPYLSTTIPTLPPPNISENLTPTSRYLPAMSGLTLDSPAHRRPRGPGPSHLSQIQVPSPRGDGGPYSNHSPSLPLTPGYKRPRYNHYPTISNGHRTDGVYYPHSRRGSLPSIHTMRASPPNTTAMAPPPTPRDVPRGPADLNVVIPSQHDQSRSVEAMVMSVQPLVKIKVLGRITPPLKDPGPTSPAMQVRGAIIAVEGDDVASVRVLAGWLFEFLVKDKEYSPRLSDPPKAPTESQPDVTFEEYLDVIKEWHGRSRDMVKYITTAVPPSSSNSSDTSGNSPSSQDASTAKPVVILPTYQLHASDVYTSRIPIQDAYSPTDHWQWMATLWRGTVGPDLTIYIKSLEGKEEAKKLVELNEEVRCLTVCKEKGGRFELSALRRVGFEVGEWIQGIGARAR